MQQRTSKTISAIFVLSFFIGLSSSSILSQSVASPKEIVNGEECHALDKTKNFINSAQELTTWYHDGSNTTGWSTSYNGWTLTSSGTALYSNITSASGTPEHAVFSCPLNTRFVVGHDFKMEAQVQYTPTGSEDGGLNLMTFYGSSFVYRLAYTASGSTKVSWAVNHYTGESGVYDSEYTMSYMSYSSMWYNSTDSSTRTNLGDGVVSTSEHASELRTINTVILDFWLNVGGSYADIRIDWIKITGGTIPEIDSPDDIEVEYSDSSYLVWTPEAYAPESFDLYIDDVLEDTGIWNGSQIAIPLTNLDLGHYKYELFVYDTLDFYASDIVWINVTDTTAPLISSIANLTIPHGIPGYYLTWPCSEPYPDYFFIEQDNTIINEGSWNGTDLSVNLSGLGVDTFVFELTVNDTSGNSASQIAFVEVITDALPNLTPLEDTTLELGSTGNYLVWDCSDEFPESYIIFKNGTEIDSGVWNGSSLAIRIDGLDLGSYVYSLFINDTSNNSATDDVIVTVRDTTNPILAGPADISFEFGITGQSIMWTAYDLSPDSLTILQNGSSIITIDWDGGNIELNLDSLSLVVGTYNFTLIIYDSSANSASDTVIVSLTQPETTPTSPTTGTTSTTNTTNGAQPIDPMLLVIAGAAGVLVLLIVVIVIMKKK